MGETKEKTLNLTLSKTAAPLLLKKKTKTHLSQTISIPPPDI